MRFLLLTLFAAAFVSQAAVSKIFIDIENDALPLVDMTIVLPVGFESAKSNESGAALFLSDILESGSNIRNRQEFFDDLGNFGADYDFSVSNQYSYYKLSFPLIEGKNYAPLIELLRENWQNPRFTADTFLKAKTKLRASLLNGLESDSNLLQSSARRYLNAKFLGGHPIFIETINGMSLNTVKNVFEKSFLKPTQIWAGVVAPPSALGLVEKLLSAVFLDSEIEKGHFSAQMNPQFMPQVNSLTKQNTALIIEKSNRSQNVFGLYSLHNSLRDERSDVVRHFANHIAVESGLGSYFSTALRTKGGFSYYVGGVASHFLGINQLGFGSNPQSSKIEGALGATAELVNNAYQKANIFGELPSADWDTNWKSFRYSILLSRATAMGRLGERLEVVTGLLNPNLVGADYSKFKLEAFELGQTYRSHWQNGTNILAIVGESKILSPLLKEKFPDFKQVVIPYKETISKRAYLK
jgi:predicted Zn-dependent peptidase